MANVLKWLRRAAFGLTGLVIVLLVAGWGFEQWSERSDQRFEPPGQLFDIGGRRMHLHCSGQGNPTVVLEPGAGEFAALVLALHNRIAVFTHVCSYDRAGYGWSDPAPAGRSFDARAADLDLLLRNANVERPYVLVGASYGGFIIRSYARQHPDRVAGVVLVDAAEEQVVFTHMPTMHEAVGSLRIAAFVSRFGLTRLVLHYLANQAKAEGRIPSDATPDVIDAAIALSVRPSAWRTALDENAAYDVTPPNERIAGGFGPLGELPLIVIRHGKPFSGLNAGLADLEAAWGDGQARLAALSANSRVIVATANGHNIAMENPALVADATRAVVESVRTGTPL